MGVCVWGPVNYFLRAFFFFFLISSPSAGSFPDAQLPSKRIIGPKNYEFLTSKREEFQEYLQVELLGTVSNVVHLFVEDSGTVSIKLPIVKGTLLSRRGSKKP